MNNLRQAIDFTKMVGGEPGEALEGLTRLLAERLDLNPEWTGRGPDGGRDLIFTQTFTWPLKINVRWFVSCKDYAKGKKAVQKGDLPLSFEAELNQYKANGFLLVTTTTISSSAKAILDNYTNRFFTDVWDSTRLRELLLLPTNEDLLKQFLPECYQRIRELEGSFSDNAERIEACFANSKAKARQMLISGIPNPLPRNETSHIEDALESGQPVLVVGEPGTGKSGIAFTLCTSRKNSSLPVLLIDAREYNSIQHYNEISSRIDLKDGIVTNVNRMGQRVGCRIIIDQLDSTSAERAGKTLVDLACECAKMPNVQVVVFSRRTESHERQLLSPLIQNGFTELECRELSDEEVRKALGQIDIDAPGNDLVALSKNLLNLSLIARIKKQKPEYDFASTLDETHLWDGYVEVLRSDLHQPRFGDELIAEAIRCAKEGLKREDRTFILEGPNKTSQQRSLESWQVIVHEEGYRYRFAHEKLQDFLYALEAVKMEWMPDQVITDIGPLRTRTVLPWMGKLYPIHCPSKRAEFIRKSLDG